MMPPLHQLLSDLFRKRIPAASDIDAPDAEPGTPQMDIIAQIANASVAGMNLEVTEPVAYKPNRFRVDFFGILHAEVKFNFSGLAVDIKRVEVDVNERNQGNCRAFIRSLYRASQAHGFEKIELTASFDGRFVWAALGFRPTEGSWIALKKHLLGRLNSTADRYLAAHVETIRQIIALDDPRSLPLLADLPGDVSDHLSPVGMVCTILLSGPVWHGELLIGDAIDERNLFG